MSNENKPIQRKSNNEMKNMARGMSKEQRKKMMKEQNPMIPLKRLMGYIWKDYKFQMLLVLAGILMSSITGVIASLFLRTLIDSYITPLLQSASPDFGPLFHTLVRMGCIYLAGALATLVYSRVMANISQGVLRDIRDELFTHMQSLPIKYFDTHSFGDIMSRYTNDTDTLRQMLSQSLTLFCCDDYLCCGGYADYQYLSFPCCGCLRFLYAEDYRKSSWQQWSLLCQAAGIPWCCQWLH